MNTTKVQFNMGLGLVKDVTAIRTGIFTMGIGSKTTKKDMGSYKVLMKIRSIEGTLRTICCTA